MMEIPVIDLSAFRQGQEVNPRSIAQQVYHACHRVGFMYLTQMGISPALVQSTFQQSHQFFSLSDAVKQRMAWSRAESNFGYIGLERERLAPDQPGDLKEAFNLTWDARRSATTPAISHLWVPELPDFHPTVLRFYDACTQMVGDVLMAIALALDLPLDFLTSRHQQQHHTLRLLHYPPLQSPPQPGQERAGSHSDYGSVTLLFQDDRGGLEVQTASGQWIAAPPIPNTVLVNTGDLLERWTNHVFCSTQHRVPIPTGDRRFQSRYSIAFFCHPDDEVDITCLETCQSPERPPRYPPISAKDYLISRLKATY